MNDLSTGTKKVGSCIAAYNTVLLAKNSVLYSNSAMMKLYTNEVIYTTCQ